VRLRVTLFVVSLLLLCSVAFAQDTCNANANIKARPGEVFVIKLESNPTTGYGWQLKGSLDPKVVKFMSTQYVPAKTNLVGSGGIETWTFKAIKRGCAKITLQYLRSWEKGVPPIKVKIYQLNVL